MPQPLSPHCHTASALVFALIALGHLWRAAAAVPITVGNVDVPLALSWGVAAGAGALSACLWRTRRR